MGETEALRSKEAVSSFPGSSHGERTTPDTRRRALSGLGPVSQTCLAPPGASLHVCEVVENFQPFATRNQHPARHTRKSIRFVQWQYSLLLQLLPAKCTISH